MTGFKIVILGPESTGKSMIIKQLAKHFHTRWVPEYARQYIDRLDRPYQEVDLLEIAKGQLLEEDKWCSKKHDLLFFDTNLIVIKIWSNYKYNRVDPWIVKAFKHQTYDFYLLMNIDLPWQPDQQREHPDQRKELFDLYNEHLKKNQLAYTLISGQGNQRLQNAIRAVENFLTSTT